MSSFLYDVCIVGGGGHVGFPLGLMFASKNKKTLLYDINSSVLDKIKKGLVPFKEEKAKFYLKKFKKNIFYSTDLESIVHSKFIIICIGTPVNKFTLAPDLKAFYEFIYKLKKKINKNQHIIIRSSVQIGSVNKIYKILSTKNITYCPERIVQGRSIHELPILPQIISGYSNISMHAVAKLFKKICKKIIFTSVIEAELIKLFTNSYRYINFSISNQLYMMSEQLGINFKNLRKNMRDGYERTFAMPSAGFASGPCLLKDTLQVSHFFKNFFTLGENAVKINENLPNFILKNLKKKYNLNSKIIGVLGLSFKAETDDIRDSLSLKLLKILKKNKINFLQSDEYYKNKYNVDANYLVKKSDIIIICVPHKKYKTLKIPKKKVVINPLN
jgi:UDP-N-acetyl-D-mannosaminuronic acid dehydrogenase